jgi:hypothetical protein
MFRDARFVPKSGNALWIETANARLLLPAIGDAGHSEPPRIVECPVRVKTGNASAGAAFPSYPTEQASRGRWLKRTGFHRTRVSLE